MYALHRVDDELFRIELDRPEPRPEFLAPTNNVYLVGGSEPTLVDAGHPSQFDALIKAIRKAGVRVDAIDRIVATSWSVEALGGAKNFPDVSPFVLSPDMVRPRHYEDHVASRRRALHGTAEELIEAGEADEPDGSDLEHFIDAHFPPVTNSLDFIPLRNGHSVTLGDSHYEVVAAPGPGPGHAALFDPDSGRLFSGRIALEGFPVELDDVQSYFVTLERLVELEAETVLPAVGEVRERGTWALERAHRFTNNFMSNAPSAMFGNPTVTEFVERDLGRRPDDFADFVLRIQTYRALMDELVRSRMIESEGAGITRRYGTDVDDPREKVRNN